MASVNTKILQIGLCEGRHDIKAVNQYIFPADFFANSQDMFDFRRMRTQIRKVFVNIPMNTFIDIYVTGYTPALVEVLVYCMQHREMEYISLKHYNKEIDDYVTQELYEYLVDDKLASMLDK